MKILLITGTMGSGKSKYIFDFIENNKYGFTLNDISCFKSILQLRDGDSIKSLAYPDKKINSINIDDFCETIKAQKKCVIVDEYQFFSPKNLEVGITQLNSTDCQLLILTGLQYYADGTEWESYKTVTNISKKLEISLDIIEAREHICDTRNCINPAKYHKLKAELGSRKFEELSVKDYDFLCSSCWTDYLKKREINSDEILYNSK